MAPSPAGALDGDLDVGFGDQGYLTLVDPQTSQPFTRVWYVLARGSTVVAAVEAPGRAGTVRVDQDGVIDPAFGDDGVAPVGGQLLGLRILADGSLVQARSIGSFGSSTIRLTRVTSTGDLDATFGTNGVVDTDLGFSTGVRDVAELPDGRIVVLVRDTFVPSKIVMLLYALDGTLDPTFGSSGIVQAVADVDVDARELEVQPDGKIVVAALSDDGLRLARFETDGSFDTTYGTGGLVPGPVGVLPEPMDISFTSAIEAAMQPDGRLLVKVAASTGGWPFVAILRFSQSGAVDLSFGTGGTIVTGLFTNPFVGVLSDGRILLSGTPPDLDGGAVERYDADGQIDLGFAPCGAALVFDAAAGFAELPNGQLLGRERIGNRLVRLGTAATLPACSNAATRKSALTYLPFVNIFAGKLVWKWKSATTVQAADFGDPLADTDYLWCMFQEGGSRPGAVRVEGVRGGEQCPPGDPAGPCWKAHRRGFLLKRDANGAGYDGHLQLRLFEGEPGRAKIVLKSRSEESAGEPSFGLPMRARLLRLDAGECCQACWEAVFSEAKANKPGDGLVAGAPAKGKFSAKSD